MENKSVLIIHNQKHFNEVMQFAMNNNVMQEFINGINYLSTYGESRDQKVRVDLYSDSSAGEKSFVASISKIVTNYELREYETRYYYTIGMVWNVTIKNWSFHS